MDRMCDAPDCDAIGDFPMTITDRDLAADVWLCEWHAGDGYDEWKWHIDRATHHPVPSRPREGR